MANVHVLRAPSAAYAGVYEPNVYLVVDGGSAVIIDGGLENEAAANERLAYLAKLGGPHVELIALTHHHRDHAGGAFLLSAATGAPIRMHAEEQRLLREDLKRQHPDVRLGPPLVDGEALSVGRLRLRVLHTPGHSAGHLCFFLEEEAVLFSGDNVLGLGTTAIPPPPDGDMALYVRSLERMKTLGASLLCPGHGPLVREPERKIQEIIDHRHEREEQLLSLLREGELSVEALLRRIYPELSPHLEGLAKGQVIAHLCKLRDEGKVGLRTEDGEIVAALCPSSG